jgi:hypothetical protein
MYRDETADEALSNQADGHGRRTMLILQIKNEAIIHHFRHVDDFCGPNLMMMM